MGQIFLSLNKKISSSQIYFQVDCNNLYSLNYSIQQSFEINDEYSNSRRHKTSLGSYYCCYMIIMKPPNEDFSYINHIIMTSFFSYLLYQNWWCKNIHIWRQKFDSFNSFFKSFIIYTRHWHIRSIPINSLPIEKVSTEKCKLCLNLFRLINEIFKKR